MSQQDFDFDLDDSLSSPSTSSPVVEPRVRVPPRRLPRSASDVLKAVRESTATTDRSKDDEFETALKRVASALSERDRYEASTKSSPTSEDYDEDFEEEEQEQQKHDLPSSLEREFHDWYDAAEKSTRDGLKSQDLWATFDNNAALRSSLNLHSTNSSSRIQLEKLWRNIVGSNDEDCVISRDAFITGLRQSFSTLQRQSTDFWMNDESQLGDAPVIPLGYASPNDKSPATLDKKERLATLDEDKKSLTLGSTLTEEPSKDPSRESSFEEDVESSLYSPPSIPAFEPATTSPPSPHPVQQERTGEVAVAQSHATTTQSKVDALAGREVLAAAKPNIVRREVPVQPLARAQQNSVAHITRQEAAVQTVEQEPTKLQAPPAPSPRAVNACAPPPPPQQASEPLLKSVEDVAPTLASAAAPLAGGVDPNVQKIIELAAAALSGANRLIVETASKNDDDDVKILAQNLALQCLSQPRCVPVRLMPCSKKDASKAKKAASKKPPPRVVEVSDEESRCYERVVARKTKRKDFTAPRKKLAWWEAAALESASSSREQRNSSFRRVVSPRCSSSSLSSNDGDLSRRRASRSRKKTAGSNENNFAFQSQFVEVVSHFSNAARGEGGKLDESELRMRTAIAESLRERLTSKETLDDIRDDVFRKLRRNRVKD